MNSMYLYTGIFVMAGVTYLIRALPMILFQKPIENAFVQSFLYYVPYAVLTAMTIPAVFSLGIPLAASMAGFAIAVLMAWKGCSLIQTAAGAAFVAWMVSVLASFM